MYAIILSMEKISEVVSDLCKSYLPKIRAVGITFDIDFPDTTITVENKKEIKEHLEKSMKSAIKRSKNGSIKLSVKKGEIKLEDTGTIIDKATCKKLTSEHFIVKSRVGFGTTFTIKY